MKHLSQKLAISFLATSVTLSSVNADRPLLEVTNLDVPSVVSFDYTTKNLAQKAYKRLNDPESIIRNLHDVHTQLKKALLNGAAAQDEAIKLQSKLDELESRFNNLNEEAQKLILENATLKIEQEKHRAEKQSTWERLKNWIFKLDATKVATTLITGLFSVLCTLLVIIYSHLYG